MHNLIFQCYWKGTTLGFIWPTYITGSGHDNLIFQCYQKGTVLGFIWPIYMTGSGHDNYFVSLRKKMRIEAYQVIQQISQISMELPFFGVIKKLNFFFPFGNKMQSNFQNMTQFYHPKLRKELQNSLRNDAKHSKDEKNPSPHTFSCQN